MPGTSFANDQGDGVVAADGFSTTGGEFDVQGGYITQTPALVAAAGSNSQSGATAITSSTVILTTVSATTRAVRLPTAVTGLTVSIGNGTATAAKVYPATGDKVGAASTNALASNRVAAYRSNTYRAVSASLWVVQVSG